MIPNKKEEIVILHIIEEKCSMNSLYIIPILTLILICCIRMTTTHCSDDDSIFCTINTNSGQIRGKQNQTLFDKVPYFSFRGIPYAKPPIGNLRFKV